MATKKSTNEAVVKPRTLLLQMNGKEHKITIPAGAHVTFGPTIPYQAKNGRVTYGGNDYSLRVYANKSKDSLIAVFSGVGSFRDIDLPMAELVVREAGKSVWKSDETGYSTETSVQREKGWHDIDVKQLNK